MNPLKRALKLRDLILLNIVAVFTPATLSQTMPLGKTGLLLWATALLAFMLPYASALADLARVHPREGGVYAWTHMAFGDFHGFICGWCYWVNTFLYVPSIFLGIAAVASLLGGERWAWLNQQPTAVALIACVALCLSAALHIFGLGQGKWIQNIGAFGRLAMAAALLGAAVWKLKAGTPLPATTNQLDAAALFALWPFVLNALVGLDLGSAMSEEADAPARDIPRSLLVGGVAIAVCYLLTYAATLVLGVPSDANPIYGHVQAITTHLPALAGFVVLIDLSGLLGSGAAWLAAPARVPFAIGLDNYLPSAFARVHPRYGTPYVALLVQTCVAVLLILACTYNTSLNDAYLVLLSGSIVLVLVTFAYLFAAWWRLLGVARPRVKLQCFVGLTATLLAGIACFVPPPAVTNVIGYELKLIGSVILMLAVGLAAYGWAQGKPNKIHETNTT
jgi:amino acid transporter